MTPKTKKIMKWIWVCVFAVLIAGVLYVVLGIAFLYFALVGSSEKPPQGDEIVYGNPPVTYLVERVDFVLPEGDLFFDLYRKNNDGTFTKLGSSGRLYFDQGAGVAIGLGKPDAEVTIYQEDDNPVKKRLFYYKPLRHELRPVE